MQEAHTIPAMFNSVAHFSKVRTLLCLKKLPKAVFNAILRGGIDKCGIIFVFLQNKLLLSQFFYVSLYLNYSFSIRNYLYCL